MNKLQRYWIDGGLCEMEPRGVFAECVHRIYLQDEADAVISALEDELAVVWLLNKHVKEKAAWEAKEKALRVFILRNADHGVDDTGEYCRAGAFTRTVFEDGTAEVYPCTCGLDELRTILNREQEKP